MSSDTPKPCKHDETIPHFWPPCPLCGYWKSDNRPEWQKEVNREVAESRSYIDGILSHPAPKIGRTRKAKARKATQAAVIRLTHGKRLAGWGSFKHALMRELGIPATEFARWDVPPDWIEAFKRVFR